MGLVLGFSAMIKRTIEISQQPAHLTVKLNQLLVQPHDQPTESHRSIPCEDIGVVLVDHQQTTYTHAALARLMAFDGVLVVCGRDHLPAGILLPMSDHSQVVWRIHDQLSISKPLKKQLWKQIVQAKIRAQAMNLPEGSRQRGRLLGMIREVRSNDSSNCESQAARIYWSAWLPAEYKFRRDPDGEPPNNMLNYGYAVIRAAIARALVAAGLLPALGLHHHNRSNAFCLADDLLEPLRPIVDHRARELFVNHERRELDQPTKAGLLEILTWPVVTELDGEKEFRGPLMIAIQRLIGSLVRCYQRETKSLVIPFNKDGETDGSC